MANICSTVDGYAWSSDQAYRERDYPFVATNLLMSILGPRSEEAISEYNRLMGLEDEGYEEHTVKYLGTDDFWDAINPNKVAADSMIKQPALETLLISTGAHPLDIDLIKSGCRKRDLIHYKRDFIKQAFESGYTMEEIGKYISISGVAVANILRR